MSTTNKLESMILACPQCHKKNRIAAERISEQPKCGQCKEALVTGTPLELTIENYKAHMSSDMPVVVDFWAPWCGPCQQFGPFYEQVAPQFAERARFAKINTQNENVLGQRYNIRSIPTIAVFHRDQEVARQAGVMSPQQLHQWVEQVLQGLS